jgi:hypothetical protein
MNAIRQELHRLAQELKEERHATDSFDFAHVAPVNRQVSERRGELLNNACPSNVSAAAFVYQPDYRALRGATIAV